MIDIHSHILPDLDDGARAPEESLEMARIAVEDGIEQMVCTPHMFNGLSGDPQPQDIRTRVSKLQEEIGNGRLKLLPGNEVHISHQIADHAREHRFCRLNNGNYMLVEFPSMIIPVGAEDLFYQLQLQGLYPILVHPERNAQFQSNPSLIEPFVRRGVFIQVTAMSVTGEFGIKAQKCAEILLRHQCVHFLATDTHRPKTRPPILSRGRDAAARIVGKNSARKLVEDNPLAVISGKVFEVPPPISFNTAASSGTGNILDRWFGKRSSATT
jgi:protein-tyrosine phosphatase